MLILITVLVLVEDNVSFIFKSVVRFQIPQQFKNEALCMAQADNINDNRNTNNTITVHKGPQCLPDGRQHQIFLSGLKYRWFLFHSRLVLIFVLVLVLSTKIKIFPRIFIIIIFDKKHWSYRELWTMTLTFKPDLDKIKTNQQTKYLGQRSVSTKTITWTQLTTALREPWKWSVKWQKWAQKRIKTTASCELSLKGWQRSDLAGYST